MVVSTVARVVVVVVVPPLMGTKNPHLAVMQTLYLVLEVAMQAVCQPSAALVAGPSLGQTLTTARVEVKAWKQGGRKCLQQAFTLSSFLLLLTIASATARVHRATLLIE